MIVSGESELLVPVDDAKKMKEAINLCIITAKKAEEIGKHAGVLRSSKLSS